MNDDRALPLFARALAVFDAWEHRSRDGRSEEFDELLQQQPDLRALLEPMRPTGAPAPPDAEPAKGLRVQQFVLEQLIGEGGQAEVWRCPPSSGTRSSLGDPARRGSSQNSSNRS